MGGSTQMRDKDNKIVLTSNQLNDREYSELLLERVCCINWVNGCENSLQDMLEWP